MEEDLKRATSGKPTGRYLKNAWAKKDANGDYWLFIEGGELHAGFLLSPGGTGEDAIERRALEAWLAAQDSTNGR